jgi:hypothetical protein
MQLTTIGLDIAKNVFQVHGIDAAEKVVVRKQLRRSQVLEFFKALQPCLVGMEDLTKRLGSAAPVGQNYRGTTARLQRRDRRRGHCHVSSGLLSGHQGPARSRAYGTADSDPTSRIGPLDAFATAALFP